MKCPFEQWTIGDHRRYPWVTYTQCRSNILFLIVDICCSYPYCDTGPNVDFLWNLDLKARKVRRSDYHWNFNSYAWVSYYLQSTLRFGWDESDEVRLSVP